jgi:hypothetical protein
MRVKEGLTGRVHNACEWYNTFVKRDRSTKYATWFLERAVIFPTNLYPNTRFRVSCELARRPASALGRPYHQDSIKLLSYLPEKEGPTTA